MPIDQDRAAPASGAAPRHSRFARLIASRHGGLILFGVCFLGVSLLTRLALLIKAGSEVTWDESLLAAFGWGLLFDLGAAALAALPLAVVLTLLPQRFFARRSARRIVFAAGFVLAYALCFEAVAEWTFWDEFGTRFNFIAVDYLVYTTEVLGNIRESYPLTWILLGLVPPAVALAWFATRSGWARAWLAAEPVRASRRFAAGGAWCACALALGLGLSENWLPSFANAYNHELAKNGLWSLFSAFRSNVIDYDQFYRVSGTEPAFARLREELVEDGSLLLRSKELDPLRYVANAGPELRPNVIQITVESLSASFLGSFNPASKLTPELDELARHSLVFDNFYATGTRTDRGMEALTLSLPPTPGRSLVKRPHNEDLFTLGSVFRAKGYDTAFLYGGYGYFDNMNYFFGHNGYRVVDRASVSAADVTFANVWGACDEDLYRWTLREADAAHAAGKPFHYFVMTTSNHRPYTFPDGRIDLPSKSSGRAGAVKYTDFAIGQLLREARSHPWFANTVFVIVADHCASSAGKSAIPVLNYHIPLFVYAPGGQIAPGRVSQLTSQMDFAPTLLGLLGWSYPSRFLGHDSRRVEEDEEHALMGNYQRISYLEKGLLCVLSPRQETSLYSCDLNTGTLTRQPHDEYTEGETIAFYESASYLYRNDLYKALSPGEFARYSAQGAQLAGDAARSQPR